MKPSNVDDIVAIVEDAVRRAYALGRQDAMKRVMELAQADDPSLRAVALLNSPEPQRAQIAAPAAQPEPPVAEHHAAPEPAMAEHSPAERSMAERVQGQQPPAEKPFHERSLAERLGGVPRIPPSSPQRQGMPERNMAEAEGVMRHEAEERGHAGHLQSTAERDREAHVLESSASSSPNPSAAAHHISQKEAAPPQQQERRFTFPSADAGREKAGSKSTGGFLADFFYPLGGKK